VRVNLDSHVSRIDLVGKDAIVLKDGKQITEFKDGILPWAYQHNVALVFDEYDRPLETGWIGSEPAYVIDDAGFRRHVPSAEIDNGVLGEMMTPAVRRHIEDQMALSEHRGKSTSIGFLHEAYEYFCKMAERENDQKDPGRAPIDMMKKAILGMKVPLSCIEIKDLYRSTTAQVELRDGAPDEMRVLRCLIKEVAKVKKYRSLQDFLVRHEEDTVDVTLQLFLRSIRAFNQGMKDNEGGDTGKKEKESGETQTRKAGRAAYIQGQKGAPGGKSGCYCGHCGEGDHYTQQCHHAAKWDPEFKKKFVARQQKRKDAGESYSVWNREKQMYDPVYPDRTDEAGEKQDTDEQSGHKSDLSVLVAGKAMGRGRGNHDKRGDRGGASRSGGGENRALMLTAKISGGNSAPDTKLGEQIKDALSIANESS
jgi:hypothetical protein